MIELLYKNNVFHLFFLINNKNKSIIIIIIILIVQINLLKSVKIKI